MAASFVGVRAPDEPPGVGSPMAHGPPHGEPIPLGNPCPILQMQPLPLPATALLALPEVARWTSSAAVAAWGSPYAPTVTAAAGLSAGSGSLPVAEVLPAMRHAVTVDCSIWPKWEDWEGGIAAHQGLASFIRNRGAAGGGSAWPLAGGADGGVEGSDLGTPVVIKSELYLPTAITPEGDAVLGMQVNEHVVPEGAGNFCTPGTIDGIGRWAFFPADKVLVVATATDDGTHVAFAEYRPADSVYVMAVVRRPVVPGGSPVLVSRVSTLSQRVDGDGGGAGGTHGVATAADSPPSALVAAQRFFAAEVGTYGAAAALALSDPSLSSLVGVGSSAARPDDPAAVSTAIMKTELASGSVVARLRSLALSSPGVHPWGLRLPRPARSSNAFFGVATTKPLRLTAVADQSSSEKRAGDGVDAGLAGRFAAAAAAPRTPAAPRRTGCRRSRIELETVPSERVRARILRNREAATRSNARRAAARAKAAARTRAERAQGAGTSSVSNPPSPPPIMIEPKTISPGLTAQPNSA